MGGLGDAMLTHKQLKPMRAKVKRRIATLKRAMNFATGTDFYVLDDEVCTLQWVLRVVLKP